MKRDAILICTAECHLDNCRKRCNMALRDPTYRLLSHRKPKRNVPQETKHEIQNSDILI